MNAPKIFMSHSVEDSEWARSFAKALNERGVTVLFDDFQVKPDESWGDAIAEALRNSDVLVPLLDGESSPTRSLLFELGAAIVLGKRVVPILPRGVDPSVLPFSSRLRRYLIRETPEQTAEDLSDELQAA